MPPNMSSGIDPTPTTLNSVPSSEESPNPGGVIENFVECFRAKLIGAIMSLGENGDVRVEVRMPKDEFLIIEELFLRIPRFIQKILGLEPKVIACIPDNKVIIAVERSEVYRVLQGLMQRVSPLGIAA